MTIDNPLTDSPTVWQPRDLESAWALKNRLGEDAVYVAGGTLLQLKWEAGVEMPRHLISLERIDRLRDIRESIEEHSITLEIGAMTSISTCRRHPVIREHWPLLVEACTQLAAPAVRNRATLGGNVMNGFGDTLSALLVYDADVVWFDGQSYKATPVGSFLAGHRLGHDTDTSPAADTTTGSSVPGDSPILTAIRLKRSLVQDPGSATRTVSMFRKVCRRAAFVPPLVTIAALCEYGPSESSTGSTIQHIRLVAGAIDFTPRRLIQSERMLLGTTLDSTLWRQVHEQIVSELDPPDTPFASADYRRLVTANVLVTELSTEVARASGNFGAGDDDATFDSIQPAMGGDWHGEKPRSE